MRREERCVKKDNVVFRSTMLEEKPVRRQVNAQIYASMLPGESKVREGKSGEPVKEKMLNKSKSSKVMPSANFNKINHIESTAFARAENKQRF